MDGPRVRRLFKAGARRLDHGQQVQIVQQMQQIAYAASPYVIFGYPQSLEGYNTAVWEGYVKVPGGYPQYSGEALGHDTYVGLKPATGPAADSTRGGSSTWIWVVVAAAVVAASVALLLVVRRRRPEVEAGG